MADKFKHHSIRARMRLMLALQVLISVLFLLYSVFTTGYQSYSDLSSRYFQTGELVLSTTENAVSELAETVLFPSSLALTNNDSTISKALKDACISRNFKLYSYFSQQARSRIVPGRVELLALYDLDGHGVAVQNGSFSEYRVCFMSGDPEWYHAPDDGPAGSARIISPAVLTGTGMPDVDGSYLCVCRGIIDTTSFRITGYCMGGISTDAIINAFEALRLSSQQQFTIYYNGTALLDSGSGSDATLFDLSAAGQNAHIKQLRTIDHVTCLVNTIHHESGFSIVLVTPVSDAIGSIGGLSLSLTIVIGLILIAIVLIQSSSVRYSMNAMRQLIDACDNFELAENTQITAKNLPDEISYLFGSFNRMSARIRALVGEVVDKQAKQQETELQLLRTQINPHYLYNTLEMIHMRAYMKKNYDIANMAELLGQNLQYGLRNTTKKVLLRTELEQVNIYLQILSYHYGNRIRTSIFIEDGLLDCRIPKLIFQPIIENSVVHGIVSADQVLSIDIMGYRSEDTIVFKISDDGCGMDEQQLAALKASIRDTNSVSIGLRNVCRRILLNYGEEYQAEIESMKNVGSTVTLYIPYIPGADAAENGQKSPDSEVADNGNE